MTAVARLHNLADLAYHEQQRERDNLPCPSCGGDRLMPNFTDRQGCHVKPS